MLHLYVADRLVPLAARLAAVLGDPPDDAFAPEWIAVPSEGVRRWLALELARHLGARAPGAGDGVTANVTHAFPGSLRAAVLQAGRDPDRPDPWEVDRLAWSVLEVLASAAADPLLAPLVETASGASLASRSRRLADLFDRYDVHRPDMVRAWAAGRDVDGTGRPMDRHADLAAHRWQPHLWRLVRARIGVDSPAQRLPALLGALRAGELRPDLPDRLTLFGLSVLPGGAGFVELASAAAATRELHLFLLDPSPDASALVVAAAPPTTGARLRRDDRSAEVVGHPLVRSWGRLPRETAVVLADARALGVPAPERLTDAAAGPGAMPPPGSVSVLGRLQASLRAGRVLPAPEAGDLDGSVQFHAAYGVARQVDALRDALLHLLADDDTLTEDDIVVLCPALGRMAPFLEAGFGPPADGPARVGGGPPSLRYRVADRSARRVNPVVAGLDALLELAGGRFDATSVLDLLAQPAVRERYGFTDDELARLDDWVRAAQVRWGLDAEHREPHGVPASVVANTWRAALDRLLLGVAVADDDPGFSLAGVVPLGVEGDDVDLVGRVADLLDHLASLAAATLHPRPVAAWVALVSEVARAVLAPARGEAWQTEAVDRAFAEAVDHATGAEGPCTVELTFLDARRLVRDRLAQGGGRADYFRGGITITSPDALRSVPHRVVALLGMDQPAFASPAVSSDDLATANPVVGDRDPRSEARQALLEAVLAAQDHLIVVREGHDLRTNQEVPPAVVVSELLEAVAAVRPPPPDGASAPALELVHPRQPFDERCFTPGALVDGRPWSFDPSGRAAAEARRHRTAEAPPFLASPLSAVDQPVVDLADLRRAVEHPIQRFVERRLQVVLPREEDARPTRLPVTLVTLDRWQVGDRLLTTALADGDVERWARLEEQLGTLPPGSLGTDKVAELRADVARLVEAAQDHGFRPGPPDVFPIDCELPDGTRIVGSVAGRLAEPEPGPALIGYGSAKSKHRLAAWLELLALTATDPRRAWRSVTIHRDKDKAPTVTDLVVTGSVEERRAHALDGLTVAVDLLRRSDREPVPLFPSVSEALHHDVVRPGLWTNRRGFADRHDRFVAFTYGHLDLPDLLAIPSRPDDPPGFDPRVARYATYLWTAVERTAATRQATPVGAVP